MGGLFKGCRSILEIQYINWWAAVYSRLFKGCRSILEIQYINWWAGYSRAADLSWKYSILTGGQAIQGLQIYLGNTVLVGRLKLVGILTGGQAIQGLQIYLGNTVY